MFVRIFDKLIPPSSGVRFPALDGLRGLAAVAVMLSHLVIAKYTVFRHLGQLSVCIFFALSAFLLYYPHVVGKPPRVSDYYHRRFWRIVPVYVFYMLFGILCVWLTGLSGPASFKNIVAHLLFIHSFVPHLARTILDPAWSIAVEVHFYILLPLLAVLFMGRRFMLVLPLIAFLVWWQLDKKGGPVCDNLPYLALPFLFGMGVAKLAAAGKKVHPIGAALGLCILLAMAFNYELYGFRNPRGLIASAASALAIWSLALAPSGCVFRILASSPMRIIGISGYSLFLLHRPFFNVLDVYFTPQLSAILGIVLAPALAIVSYTYIEAPAITFGKRFISRTRKLPQEHQDTPPQADLTSDPNSVTTAP